MTEDTLSVAEDYTGTWAESWWKKRGALGFALAHVADIFIKEITGAVFGPRPPQGPVKFKTVCLDFYSLSTSYKLSRYMVTFDLSFAIINHRQRRAAGRLDRTGNQSHKDIVGKRLSACRSSRYFYCSTRI